MMFGGPDLKAYFFAKMTSNYEVRGSVSNQESGSAFDNLKSSNLKKFRVVFSYKRLRCRWNEEVFNVDT